MTNESTDKGNMTIQTLGVDISNSPPKTCAILASLLPNGTMEVHDEIVVDRELSREEVEHLSKYIASCFEIAYAEQKLLVDAMMNKEWNDL